MAAVQYPSYPAPHVVFQGQPGALPMQVVAQQPATVLVQNTRTSEAYNAKSAKTTGWMQLSCAIACIVIGIIEIIVGSPLSFVGTGIWSGLLIVAYMVMSIISAVFGVIVTAMGISAANTSSAYAYSSSYYDNETQGVRIAFDLLLVVTGLLELSVAVVAAGFCCAGVCCGRTTSSANTSTMVYNQQGNVIPVVMMVPAYGQPVSGQQQPAPVSQPEGHYTPLLL